jgi:hypothetical protein
MAGKPRNRFELRRQYEAAEPLDPMEDESEDAVEVADDDEAEARPKKKAKAPAKKKPAKSAKPAKPAARMRVVWQVVNDAFKTVATFEYAQKEAAEAKAAEMTAKGKGVHFIQRVKEAMPDDAPGLGAAIARPAPAEAPAKAAKAAPEPDDEEIEEEAEADDFEEDEEEEDVDDEE